MDILVSCEWLAERITTSDITVLDASAHLPAEGRDPEAEFHARHIAGAQFLDLPSLKDTASPVPSALPTAAQFAGRMQRLGVDTSDQIVLYDNSALRSSARAFFMFKMFGHENVAVLDGGLARWEALSLPVRSGTGQSVGPAQSGYHIAQDNRSRVRSKAEMLGNIASGKEQVVDARDAMRFTGESEDAVHGLSGGHIPGARNVHFSALLRSDGTFQARERMRETLQSAGLNLNQPIVASCGSGMTASVVLFALELLGHEPNALYDGSWAEWGADPATPKETGPAR